MTRPADAQDLIQQLKQGETFIPRKKKEEPPTVIEPEEDSNQGTECISIYILRITIVYMS